MNNTPSPKELFHNKFSGNASGVFPHKQSATSVVQEHNQKANQKPPAAMKPAVAKILVHQKKLASRRRPTYGGYTTSPIPHEQSKKAATPKPSPRSDKLSFLFWFSYFFKFYDFLGWGFRILLLISPKKLYHSRFIYGSLFGFINSLKAVPTNFSFSITSNLTMLSRYILRI